MRRQKSAKFCIFLFNESEASLRLGVPMVTTKRISKGRTFLIWSIIVLIVPFGFTLENPVKEIDAFLGRRS